MLSICNIQVKHQFTVSDYFLPSHTNCINHTVFFIHSYNHYHICIFFNIRCYRFYFYISICKISDFLSVNFRCYFNR